jgi:hypothetical protein
MIVYVSLAWLLAELETVAIPEEGGNVSSWSSQ